MSHLERQKVRNIIEVLVKNYTFQESDSSYTSPILLVNKIKKNRESRRYADYRALKHERIWDEQPAKGQWCINNMINAITTKLK